MSPAKSSWWPPSSPQSAARDVVDVTFFADGTKVCAVTSTPFECQWDAGARIRSRQIRVVATLKTAVDWCRRSRHVSSRNTSRTSR